MYKKYRALLAQLLVCVMLLAACGENSSVQDPEPEEAVPLTLTVCVEGAQDTLDPACVTAQGGEMILYHLYENLMRWEDDGSGWAALAPGQAESYTVETDYAGNATYTFTLREGISWSDGKAVTASDFVNTWRRLADPSNALPHRELLAPVSGYEAVQETGDVSLLAVSAPDAQTFVVSLNGSCAWFLEEICASAWTMPVRDDVAFDGAVTNGAYTAVQFSPTQTVLERSGSYYDQARLGPDAITFVPSEGAGEDYSKLSDGSRDLITALPDNVWQEQLEAGVPPEPVTCLTAVLLNTQQPPFDNPDVRLAFRLVVDTQAVANTLGGYTQAAAGIVPYGVADYGDRPVVEKPAEDDPSLPDPNAVPAGEEAEPMPAFWDFRSHSLQKVTVPVEDDYAADCQEAISLLNQAGYPNGNGFPEVEYIYVNSDEGQALAAVLRSMWQEKLGVSVTVTGLSQEEYDARLAASRPADGEEPSNDGDEDAEAPIEAPSFTMAAQDITTAYSDAGAILGRWHSASTENVSGYHSDAFDILMNAAESAVSSEVRDAYLHDAEAILLAEAPVIPVYCQGGGYLLREGLTGLYRAPNGVYFLDAVTHS